jgi:hypothetical protein
MIKKNIVALLFSGLACNDASAQIVASNPHAANKSSHFIVSGDLKIGISNKAGGAINSVIIPKTSVASDPNSVDIMGTQAETYGRLSQVNIRDSAHNAVYNPTQAGFNETLGTQCVINSSTNPSKLNINKHRMSLWRGDGRYDYIKNESVGSDGYQGNNLSEGDVDNVNETTQTQSDEVGSEFSFGGYFEDFKPRLSSLASLPAVGVILFHSEIDFNYMPGFCLSQFSPNGQGTLIEQVRVPRTGALVDGNRVPIFQTSKANPDISNTKPNAINAGTFNDLSYIPARLTFTWDFKDESGNTIFDPKYRYFRNSGTWSVAEDRYSIGFKKQDFAANTNRSAIMVSEAGADGTAGRSFCIYKAATKNNATPVVGKSTSDNTEIYRDNRIYGRDLGETRERVAGLMSIMYFTSNISGLINKGSLNNVSGAAAYESIEQDYFFIYGRSPQQVKNAVDALDAYFTDNSNLVLTINSGLEGLSDSMVGNESVSIYPNPATDIVTIKLSDGEADNINIYNVAGKLVYSMQNVTYGISVSTSQIGGSGTYIIKTSKKTQKLIIR